MNPTAVQNSLGQTVRVGKQLGKGGEGVVHAAAGREDIALKLYWESKAAERHAKIQAMVAAAWHKSNSFVAFPVDLLYGPNGKFVGFAMKKISGHKPVHLLYSPACRKREFAIASFRFLLRA